MLERIGAISLIIGTILGGVGVGWLFLRMVWNFFRKSQKHQFKVPMRLVLASLLLTSLPIVANSLLTHLTSLGPLNKNVNGERHLTLTGWDQHDYSVIVPFADTIVLQMANSDVNDDTLTLLKGMSQLRELDLNNSAITDAGLAVIADLPSLQDLRLARTKITDNGFREHLLTKKSLMNLDLTGTSVASKSVREWKSANPDRKAIK